MNLKNLDVYNLKMNINEILAGYLNGNLAWSKAMLTLHRFELSDIVEAYWDHENPDKSEILLMIRRLQ
mgnify:FL=1|tara:strand:+ start:340 stop:543 length:204 start_codon:yes stop_codon:yes gene_type:complete